MTDRPAEAPAFSGSSGFRRAFAINFASQAGGSLLLFGVSLGMARLLSPAQLGLYAIAAVCANIAHVLRDCGVAGYLQREQDLTPEKIRRALGLLCGCCWPLGLLLFVAAWPLSGLYGQAELRPLLQVLALGFAFVPFSATMAGLMHRELAAGRIAYVSRAGNAAYALTGLGLAYAGCGAMSLAWANLASIAACCLAYLPLRPPGLWPSFARLEGMARFGTASLLTNMLGAVNNALPSLLLGKFASPEQVGLLGRANAAVGLLSAVAGSSMNFGSLAWLARVHHRNEPLASVLNRSAALLTGIGWPVLALIALLGRELVALLFGPAWSASVPAIPALALAAAVGLTFNFSSTGLTAIGRPDLAAWPIVLSAALRIGSVFFCFDGGATQFAALMLIAALATAPLQLLLNTRHLGQSPASMVQALWPSLLATGASALPVLALGPYGLMLVPPAWFLTLQLSGHPLSVEIHQLLPLLRLRSTIRK